MKSDDATTLQYLSEPVAFAFSSGRKAILNQELVWVKKPLPNLESEKQFLTEMLTLKDIKEVANILMPLEATSDYIAFPYIEKSLLDFQMKLSDTEITQNVIRPLLKTLIKIHSLGIIHSDIKLENIRVNKNFDIYLADFGKAVRSKNFNPHITQSLPQHHPADITYSPQFDIFSIGVMAYQLLFGIHFIRDFQSKDRNFDTTLTTTNISKKLLNFILIATEYNVGRRFQSAQQAFDYLFEKEPVEQKIVIEKYSIANNFEIYLEFMKQTFIASHHSQRFDQFIGDHGEKYFARLDKLSKSDNALIAHIKMNSEIIGIVEASIKDDFGIISTLFISQNYRQKGFARKLEQHALDFFKNKNCNIVILNVAKTNLDAITYYRRMNWIEIQSNYPDAIGFQKNL